MCLWLLSSTWTCWWKLRPPDLGRSWIGFEARQNMSVFVYSRQLKSAACQGPKRYEIGIIWAIADTLLPIRRWWLFLSGTDIGRHKNTDCPYISWFKAGILYYKILIQRREDLVKIFIKTYLKLFRQCEQGKTSWWRGIRYVACTAYYFENRQHNWQQ